MTLLPVPAGPPIETMPTARVGQELDGDALLGGPTVQIEQRAVAPHEVDALVVAHTTERGLRPGRAGDQRDARVAGQIARLDEIHDPLGEQLVDGLAVDFELDVPAPGRVAVGELVAVFVGVEANDARLQPQREVLGHDRDEVALVGEVLGDGEDAVVVVVRRERRGQSGRVLVVQLDPQRTAGRVDDE